MVLMQGLFKLCAMVVFLSNDAVVVFFGVVVFSMYNDRSGVTVMILTVRLKTPKTNLGRMFYILT